MPGCFNLLTNAPYDLLLGNSNVCSQGGGVFQFEEQEELSMHFCLTSTLLLACLLALTTADQTPGSFNFYSSITCQVLFTILKQVLCITQHRQNKQYFSELLIRHCGLLYKFIQSCISNAVCWLQK
jgi:hypothetical protein